MLNQSRLFFFYKFHHMMGCFTNRIKLILNINKISLNRFAFQGSLAFPLPFQPTPRWPDHFALNISEKPFLFSHLYNYLFFFESLCSLSRLPSQFDLISLTARSTSFDFNASTIWECSSSESDAHAHPPK